MISIRSILFVNSSRSLTVIQPASMSAQPDHTLLSLSFPSSSSSSDQRRHRPQLLEGVEYVDVNKTRKQQQLFPPSPRKNPQPSALTGQTQHHPPSVTQPQQLISASTPSSSEDILVAIRILLKKNIQLISRQLQQQHFPLHVDSTLRPASG